ncbi:HNH endonuclease signature motif containing protein [Corynebacterium oculi]|uniref:HNH endonuclease n=1 Tax=Corynebacterium oculi TaxID=1544416 RepID=UPI00316AC2BF
MGPLGGPGPLVGVGARVGPWGWPVGSRWAGRRATRLTAATLAAHGTVCHLCGLPGATTADHVVPRAAGGDDSLENLRPAHSKCNSARGDKSLSEWFAVHPLRSSRCEPSRDW